MKRYYLFLSAVLSLSLLSCGGDEYGDFRKALRHQHRMMDEFTVAVAGASGPEEIAGALEKFRNEAVAGRELMAKLAGEHPGLPRLEKDGLPEDVRAALERIEEATPGFIAAWRRIEEEYGGDPVIRQALDEMEAVLNSPPR